MSNPSESFSGIGRVSAFVLGLVVFVCITLIGFSGFLKYRLDRAEVVLAAPESALATGQEAPEKLRRLLGYSGFVGEAQAFLNTHDRSIVTDMKSQLKLAQQEITRLPDRTPFEVRHDMQAIIDTFAIAQHKAELSTTDSAVNFTNADMASLYATLPVLDARVQGAVSSNRLAAQNDLKIWAALLTLVSWVSLIIAASMTAGIYLSLRGRYTAPMRALVQSVQNMSRGDMQTPVWGMERRDPIGELARAVDLARYHFSQLPDMSLLSDQGPVRIRFEGNARSLFEAMMRHITHDSEQVRQQANGLAEAIRQQQNAISQIASTVEGVLSSVQNRSIEGDKQVQGLIHSLSTSGKSLQRAQEYSSAQLNRLIPFMQERAQGMAEITQITGKQVSQVLQSLVQAESTLRTSAELGQQSMQKLATSSNELGERLFASVNLMQASGKILTETTETAQSRLNEAVRMLNLSEANLRQMLEQSTQRMSNVNTIEQDVGAVVRYAEESAKKMDLAVRAITVQNDALGEQVALGSNRMQSIIHTFENAQRTINDVAAQLNHNGTMFSAILGDLKSNNERLLAQLAQGNGEGHNAIQQLAQQGQELVRKIEDRLSQQAQAAQAQIERLTEQTGHILAQAGTATQTFSNTTNQLRTDRDKFDQFTKGLQNIGSNLEQRAKEAFDKTENMAVQNFNKLTELSGQIGTIVERLSILGQLTGTLGAVAGQLGQVVPALANGTTQNSAMAAEPLITELKAGFASTTKGLDDLRHEFEHLLRDQAQVKNEKWPEQLQSQWHHVVAQIEAARENLSQIVAQQTDKIEMRLMVMDKKIADSEATAPEQLKHHFQQQTQVLNEMASALGAIDAHMQELEGAFRNLDKSALGGSDKRMVS